MHVGRSAPFERIGTARQELRKPLIADELPVPDPLLDLRVVPDQLGVQLVQTTLLVVQSQAPEATGVAKPAVAQRDLRSPLELLEGAQREVEDAKRPGGRPNEPNLL